MDHESTTAGYVVIARGYTTPDDGGGGQFTDIDTCDGGAYQSSGGNNAGDTLIYYSITSGLAPVVGSSVTDSTTLGIFQPGTVITSVSTGPPSTITVSVPIKANLGAGDTLVVGGNGGTLIKSSVGTLQCFQKIDYRGDPHEWGAVGDGVANDGPELLSWLGYSGPWIASIPATYMTYKALSCWPYVNIQATANNAHEMSTLPLVQITVGTGFPQTGTSGTPLPVLTAYHACRISGLSINAKYPKMSMGGTCNLSLKPNCYVDAVDLGSIAAEMYMGGGNVVIDSHTLLQNGFHNLNCPALDADSKGNSGGQLKDSQFSQSFDDNILIQCPNVRIIGDQIEFAGSAGSDGSAAGINAQGEDLTISNGNVASSNGIGIWLNNATYVSITGMFIENNGNAPNSGAGLEIDNGHTITVCANHFKTNDNAATTSAHVRFADSPAENTFCSNVYQTSDTSQPHFVYDVPSGSSVDVIHTYLYESPVAQNTGVFSNIGGTGYACAAGLFNRQITLGMPSCH